MKKINRIKYIIAAMLALFVFAVTCDITSGGGLKAFAASSTYTSAIEDLTKDREFNFSAYEESANDTSIQIIQIAEGESGELFVYTHQPCQNTIPLTATDINMSLTDKIGGVVNSETELTDEDKPKLYSLTLLSSWGVLCKYKVNGFTVSADKVRYYNIASILREFNKNLGDTGSSSESILEKKAFEVGKLFIAKTENGVIKYECQQKETVQIINPFFDYLEYPNGFKLYYNRCRSHYIAFSTDRKIDFLMEADVSYVTVACSKSEGLGLDGSITRKKPVPHERETIDYKMTGKNEADGWFSTKYVWDRIESVDDFVKNENLTESTIKDLDGLQWVIRYTETDIWASSGMFSTTTFWTDVESVTILRLKFITDGVTYNLGAVSDMGHSDDTPGNNLGKKPIGFWAYVWRCIVRLFSGTANVFEIIVAVVAIVAACMLLSILLKLLSLLPFIGSIAQTVLNIASKIIFFPFALIDWLVKKKGDD